MELTAIKESTMIFTATNEGHTPLVPFLFDKGKDAVGETVEVAILETIQTILDVAWDVLAGAFYYLGMYVPEAMMFVTAIFGVVIMLTQKVGKPIGWWSAFMLGAVIWRISL